MTLPLRTPRFLLRDFAPGDEAAFVAYQTDPGFARFHGPEDVGEAAARALLARFIAWAGEAPRRNWQLAVLREGELVGCAGLRGEGLPAGEAEFGIELARPAWGRHGYALEVSRALLAFGFGALGLAAIRAETVSANAPAARIAAHLGFRRVAAGPVPEWMRARGWHAESWRLARGDWAATASARHPPPPSGR